MVHRIGLRRVAAALLISAALSATPGLILSGTPARASTRRLSTVPTTVCSYRWRVGPRQMKRLIRCAARHWRVRGGPDKAVDVARCESRFRPRAYNPGGYGGVFQQSTYYWPSRSRTYGFPDWSVFNGRANVIVSMRMVHRNGWIGWSCA